MLNKECCQKCWNSTYFSWTEFDEIRWKERMVYCPPKYRDKRKSVYGNITDRPPIKCPFILEHIL